MLAAAATKRQQQHEHSAQSTGRRFAAFQLLCLINQSISRHFIWRRNSSSDSNESYRRRKYGTRSAKRRIVFQKKWRQNSNHYNYGMSYQN